MSFNASCPDCPPGTDPFTIDHLDVVFDMAQIRLVETEAVCPNSHSNVYAGRRGGEVTVVTDP